MVINFRYNGQAVVKDVGNLQLEIKIFLQSLYQTYDSRISLIKLENLFLGHDWKINIKVKI